MKESKDRSVIRAATLLAGAASLTACLIAPALYVLGRINEMGYKAILLAASAAWFLCAAALAAGTGRRNPG